MSGMYVARFRRDKEGYWLVDIPSIQGCLTYGRSLNEARANIREALSLCVDDADDAEIVERIGPRTLAAVVTKVRKARGAAERARERYEHETQEFQKGVRRMTKMGISMRDAASLLGISHQRVGQIVDNGPAPRRRTKRRARAR